MGSIDIFNPLSTVLSSAFNNSQQHQEINSCECRESNMGPLGATREHHPLCYAVLLRQCLIDPDCSLSVNLFIKKAFMKSRNHFGTPMPLHLNIIDLKVKILPDPLTLSFIRWKDMLPHCTTYDWTNTRWTQISFIRWIDMLSYCTKYD